MARTSFVTWTSLVCLTLIACSSTDTTNDQGNDDSSQSDEASSSNDDDDDNDDHPTREDSSSSSTDDDDDDDNDDGESDDNNDSKDDSSDDDDDDTSNDETTSSAGSDSSADDETTPSDDPDQGTFIKGLTLSGVEFNQATAITVAIDGKTVTPDQRNARLVRHRPALVRAIYSRDDDFTTAMVEGRLTLYREDGTIEILSVTREVDADADLTKLGKTFEWRLTAEQMVPGLRYSVGLFAPKSDSTPPPQNPPRIPESGSDELGIPDDLMRVEVVVVQIEVNGTKADFSQENLDHLHRHIFEHFPAEEIAITLRPEVVESASCKDDNGATCLQVVEQARAADQPAAHVYYLGLGHEGNVGGMSNVASPTMQSAAQRASFAFVGTASWEGIGGQIAGHELGHAHNSPHTPGCGAAGTVSDYPHLNADGESALGVWGYAIERDLLIDPDTTQDIMCYCQPHWSSDYTYEKWANVVQAQSSWPQYAGDDGLERVDLLRGHLRGDKASWWVVRDVLPNLPALSDAKVRITSIEGISSAAPIYFSTLADGEDIRSVYIPLPARALDLDSIAIEVAGKNYAIDHVHALQNSIEPSALPIRSFALRSAAQSL